MISVLVLQNCMALLKGEPGSSNKRCVSSIDKNEVIGIEAEKVSNMTEEEHRESPTIPVIKTEPTVSVTDISCRLYPEFPSPTSVSL